MPRNAVRNWSSSVFRTICRFIFSRMTFGEYSFWRKVSKAILATAVMSVALRPLPAASATRTPTQLLPMSQTS